MIFEIYLSKLFFYSVIAFLFGAFIPYYALDNLGKEKDLDIFLFFKKINLIKILDFLWYPFDKIFIPKKK